MDAPVRPRIKFPGAAATSTRCRDRGRPPIRSCPLSPQPQGLRLELRREPTTGPPLPLLPDSSTPHALSPGVCKGVRESGQFEASCLTLVVAVVVRDGTTSSSQRLPEQRSCSAVRPLFDTMRVRVLGVPAGRQGKLSCRVPGISAQRGRDAFAFGLRWPSLDASQHAPACGRAHHGTGSRAQRLMRRPL